ncbi:MAG: helix-hairpin-helix domain-containing protein [Acidobacteriota bacterium]|nr:helix-hairpin-helix domain-containing protein [Acidobacteriota bacterium]
MFVKEDRLLKFRSVVIVALVCSTAVFCSCARLPLSASNSESSSNTAALDSNPHRVEINTASASELEKLPGIGKGLAERIVAHREQHGPFRRVEHLMMVPGISEKKFRELQRWVRVE